MAARPEAPSSLEKFGFRHMWPRHALRTGSAIVVGEVRVGDHVSQVSGDIATVLREDHARVGVIALLAEQAQAVIEAIDVPGVGHREGDLGLGQDGIEVLGLVLGDLGLVVVHEPRVVGVRHAVDLAVGAGDGVDLEVAVLLLHLLLGVGAQLADGLGVHQNAQLIGCEHVDIGCGGRIGADLLGRVAFGDHVILPRDLVLRVSLGEVLFDLAQPVGVLGLILLRSPHAQRDGLGGAVGLCAAIVAGTASGERQKHSSSRSQTDSLSPIDLHRSSFLYAPRR